MIWMYIAIYGTVSAAIAGIFTGVSIMWDQEPLYNILEFVLLFLFWHVALVFLFIYNCIERYKEYKKEKGEHKR